MKRYASLIFALLASACLFAEISIPFDGGNNSGIDLYSTFAVDLNDGSTGIVTNFDADLWFQYTPYADRNITPNRNKFSASLKMTNSACYAWRGYNFNTDNASFVNDKGSVDQAKSIYFGTFIAQLQYGPWWIRLAGIDPQITMSQASIRSMLQNVINERTGDKNQYFRLPLLHSGGPYSGHGGTTSVLARDLVHLNRPDVEIYGMYSVGYDGRDVQVDLKGGSWKDGHHNEGNAWVVGADVSWNVTLKSKLTFNAIYAINYSEYEKSSYDTRETLPSDQSQEDVANHGMLPPTSTVVHPSSDDSMADNNAMTEAPFAFGLGFQHNFDLKGFGVLRPYVGVDFIFQTSPASEPIHDDFDFEVGGGVEWLFRGTGATFKRDKKLGGMQLSGDTANQVGLGLGVNVDRNGVVNAVLSFNEDPESSPIKNFGGFFQVEFMNIGGQEYQSPKRWDGSVKGADGKDGALVDGPVYNDFLVACIVQLEYRVNRVFKPYVFAWYVPSVDYGASSKLEDGTTVYSRNPYNNYNDNPTYNWDDVFLLTKIGCRITPFDHFYIDAWYQRTDIKNGSRGEDWDLDTGMISFCFGVRIF